jgi:outer membrane protein assembly factor BamD (BamD/ComL family)
VKKLIVLISVMAAVAQADDSTVQEHYRKALQLRDAGDLTAAVEEVARGIALNPSERRLMAQSELLIAELYMKLGMLDAAETTIRQMQMLYSQTDFEQPVAALSKELSRLRKQSDKNQESL